MLWDEYISKDKALEEVLKAVELKPEDWMALYNGIAKATPENVAAVPCKVGDTLWSNVRPAGLYLKVKDAPYPCRVVFIGINNSEEFGGGFVNVVYKNGKREMMLQFNFNKFGEWVFTSREEAIEDKEKSKGHDQY